MKYTYDFQDQVRDVQEFFFTALEKRPIFASLIKYDPSSKAESTKVEWLNDKITVKEAVISALVTDGDGTQFDVPSSDSFRVGDVVRFTSAAGATKTELAKVTAINSGTRITISRDFGGTTGVTLIVGDKIVVSSRPIPEGSEAGQGDANRPSSAHNFMQIFADEAYISGTDANVRSYGYEELGKKINDAVQRKMYSLMNELNDASLYGVPVQRTTSETSGLMGGVLHYIGTGNVESVGGAVSEAVINNMFEKIFLSGGESESLALVCNTNQARKLTGLLTIANDKGVRPSEVGGAIKTFYGDIAGTNFGGSIVVDPRFPKDQIAVLDMSKIELVALQNRGLQDFDATKPGEDGVRRRLLMEISLKVRNADTCHGLIKGLTI